MTYRALLIGNSVFDADAGLNPLNAPVKDVARLHRALVDGETGLFEDDEVRLVTERSCDNMLDELDRFFSAGRKDDLLLLYYSGHGVLDERNQLYLCGRDTRSDRLLRTGISNVRINEFVAQSMCQRIVIVLDCCFSGMFKGGGIGTQLAGPGRYIVSSTRGADLANDAATATGTSLFTEHLVEGMLGAAVDSNGDGYIDLREIYDYVRDQLLETTKQVPHCRFDGDAAVSLARVRKVPAIARAVPPGDRRPIEPTFALAENTITLHDVEDGEQLRPELVEAIKLGDDPIELTADTDDEWLQPTVSARGVIVGLRPHLGRNRGKITVRDKRSGSAQVLRVEVHVRPATVPTPPKDPTPPPQDPTPPPQTPPMPPPEPQPAYQGWYQPQPQWSPPTYGQALVPAHYGAPAPPRRNVRTWLPLGTASLGGLLLIIAFSGIPWYRIGSPISVGDLNKGASSVHAGLAEAFFGGLDWVFILAATALAILASLPFGQKITWLRWTAFGVAALGLVLMLTALNDLWTTARKQGVVPTDAGVWAHNSAGLGLACWGFLLVGVAGFLRRRTKKQPGYR